MKHSERLDSTKEGCIKYLRKALVGDDAGQYAISVVEDDFAQLEATIDLLSKDYSAICTKCGYMRPATEIEKENASARAIMQKFVDKVDRGVFKTRVTYAEMKQWMEDE